MASGVYEIVNTVNGKRYVGSSVNMPKRWRTHRRELGRECHHSQRLQRSWTKYGPDAFEFRVLLICHPEHAVMYEQIAMDVLFPALNMSPTAGNVLGLRHSEAAHERHSAASRGRRLSEEAKRLISESQRGRKHPPEFGAAISARNMGVPRPKSEEHRAKLSAALMGHHNNAGIPKSEEHRRKLSEAKRGIPNPKTRGNKSRTGMKTDPQIVARQVESLKANWAKRKAAKATE